MFGSVPVHSSWIAHQLQQCGNGEGDVRLGARCSIHEGAYGSLVRYVPHVFELCMSSGGLGVREDSGRFHGCLACFGVQHVELVQDCVDIGSLGQGECACNAVPLNF
jgi:hypothetical protein